MTTLSTVRFPSVRSTKPTEWVDRWDDLCDGLSTHRKATVKAHGNLWSPVAYVPGTTRGNANVAQVTCAVIDVDDGTPLEGATSRLAGVEWFAYSTFSDTPDHPRFHVVIPLEVPHPAASWSSTYKALRTWLGVGDSTSDPARMFYRPQAPADAEPWTAHQRGDSLRVQSR